MDQEQDQLPLFDQDPGADSPAADLVARARALFAQLEALDEDTRIDTINALKVELGRHSPHSAEPVDTVVWVRADQVQGNAYNPNVVAPPQMKLLEKSIAESGFTQPVVAWREKNADSFEVVDGFHRWTLGSTSRKLTRRLKGRIPLAVINDTRTGLADRQAATVQHNAARGRHTVDGLAEMVLDLVRQGKSHDWICQNLGMDRDEVLRLSQTQGLAELYADEEFSQAWTIEVFEDGADDDGEEDR